ncbi:MAG: hypothetical protein WBK20_15920 [Spirochaetota bacterium]
MYAIVPVNLLASEYNVLRDDTPVAVIKKHSLSLKDKGIVIIGDKEYRVYREGAVHGDWILEDSSNTCKASATKQSFIKDEFIIRWDKGEIVLKAKPFRIKNTFMMYHNNREVGSIIGASLFSRTLYMHLSAEIPLDIIVFAIYCALIIIERKSSSS